MHEAQIVDSSFLTALTNVHIVAIHLNKNIKKWAHFDNIFVDCVSSGFSMNVPYTDIQHTYIFNKCGFINSR